MKVAYPTVGFGYDPADVYAWYTVKEGRDCVEMFLHTGRETYHCATISVSAWSAVKKGVEIRLNQVLKKQKLKVGHFKKGETVICRLLGKLHTMGSNSKGWRKALYYALSGRGL